MQVEALTQGISLLKDELNSEILRVAEETRVSSLVFRQELSRGNRGTEPGQFTDGFEACQDLCWRQWEKAEKQFLLQSLFFLILTTQR